MIIHVLKLFKLSPLRFLKFTCGSTRTQWFPESTKTQNKKKRISLNSFDSSSSISKFCICFSFSFCHSDDSAAAAAGRPHSTEPRHDEATPLFFCWAPAILYIQYERKEEEGETFQKVYKERSPVAMWRHWPGRPARRLHQPSSGHKETWQKLRDNFLQFDFNQQPFLNNTISRSFPEEIIFPLDLRLSSFQFSSFAQLVGY